MKKRTFSLRTGFLVLLLAAAVSIQGCGTNKTAEQDPSAGALKEQAAAEQTEGSGLEITDDLDRSVTFSRPPVKAAALTASFAQTWMLAGGELAAAPKDAWDDLKLDMGETVMDLGKYNEINQEVLFASEPDIVIASSKTNNHLELMKTLERSGIPVLYFEVNSFEDYLRMLKKCTVLTGREDLFEKNGIGVKQKVETAIAAAKDKTDDPKILLLRTSGTGVKAKGSDGAVAGLILRDLGCVNIADGSDLLEDLSLEKIIAEDPEYIFILQQGNDAEEAERAIKENLSDNPAWKELTAVREDRVYWLDRYLYQFKPNDRWGEAYEELEKILYGAS